MKPAITRLDASQVDPKTLVEDLVNKRVREVHLMSLLYGATVFIEKGSGKICVQENSSMQCYERNEVEKAVEKIGKMLEKSEAVIIIK